MDKKPYPAEKARGGEIILPLRRFVFLAGLMNRNDRLASLLVGLHSPGDTV